MSTTPVKLTPPSLSGTHPRTRLFRRLDSLRDTPALWITSPAGAGKTTLIASYLQTRKITPLWYRIDPGDRDPTSVFHYLRKALRQHERARQQMASCLPPDRTTEPAALARDFFRELFTALKPPSTLVFDDLDCLADNAPLHQALLQAIREIPPGHRLILISRGMPPGLYARALGENRLARLDWQDLRLDDEEVRAIAGRLTDDGPLPPSRIQTLQQRAGGWMTGLILQLGAPGKTPAGPATGGEDRRLHQRFAAYFANEVYRHLPRQTRKLLLRSAWLRTVSPETAARLTGVRDARARLDWLAHHQVFVTRQGDGYVYHPLFRDFLQARAKRHLPVATRERILRETGALLLEAGDADSAADLFQATAQWPALAGLIRARAADWLRQGRHRRLQDWLHGLPTEVLASDPWLRYWQGCATLAEDPRTAGDYFRKAYDGFGSAQDTTGLCLAWLGIMDGIMYANDSLAEVPHWLAQRERLLETFGPPPDPAITGRIAFTAFNMGFLACPERQPADAWAAEAEALRRQLPRIPDHTARCLAAASLAMCFTWHPQPARLRLLADDLHPLIKDPQIAPIARVIASLVEITRRWTTGETGGTPELIDHALALVARHGVTVGRQWLLSAAILYYLTREDAARAASLLARYRENIQPDNRHEQGHYHYLAGWLAWQQGEPELAREHTARACADTAALHTPHFELLALSAHAYVLIEAGDFGEARAALQRARRLAARTHSRSVEQYYLGLLAAWQAWREGRREEIPALLRPAFACAREMELQVVLWHLPPVLSQLCAIALEHGIETTFVQNFIRRNRLPRPPGGAALHDWPCTFRIHTLGRFSIQRSGLTLDTGGRSHRKPLRLLKVLIALGGRGVPAARIEDILWPEAEGNDAHRSLITTLQRLRRLLGDSKLIRFDDGRLTLDGRDVWLDVWALESALRVPEARRLEPALRYYQGVFLPEEGDAYWLLATRERLHDAVLHGYERLGRELARAAEWKSLIEHYRRGLDTDDLHEPFYRELMRAYLRLGREGEAARLYRRCEQRMRHGLGLPPSSATRQLLPSPRH